MISTNNKVITRE